MVRFSSLGVCAPAAAFGGRALPALADVVWAADRTRSRVRLSVSHLVVAELTGSIPIGSATIVTADAETVPLLIDAMVDAAAAGLPDPITFASERVLETGPGTFLVEGELTMCGITRPISFDARLVALRSDDAGGRRLRYDAVGNFNRSDYGLTSVHAFIGNRVTLHVTIEAVNSPHAP